MFNPPRMAPVNSGNQQSTMKVGYETPAVFDHGSISDHTFARRCVTIRLPRRTITLCFPVHGGLSS
jgi:hypothetical protein